MPSFRIEIQDKNSTYRAFNVVDVSSAGAVGQVLRLHPGALIIDCVTREAYKERLETMLDAANSAYERWANDPSNH